MVQELSAHSGTDAGNWGRSFGESGLGARLPHISQTDLGGSKINIGSSLSVGSQVQQLLAGDVE